jgi:drug/metabolite transporter (DMT)-like permease
MVVVRRRVRFGPRWWRRQTMPPGVLCLMGLLDSSGGLLSTIGGAFTAGGLQNLLNQAIIPSSLALSYVLLGQHLSLAQVLGAAVILCGAVVAVVPTFAGGGNGSTTAAGATLYFLSIFPGALSNVYKDCACCIDWFLCKMYGGDLRRRIDLAACPSQMRSSME